MSSQHAAFGVNSSFRKRADSAAFYEAWVGAVLARAGLTTIHQPFTIAKTVGDVASYAHTFDLEVGVEQPASMGSMLALTEVEVKSTNLAFSTPEDYPFDTVLVCSQNSFLRKWPGKDCTGRDFLFVSRDTGAILWLPKGTGVTLGNETFDSSRGELYKTVEVPKKALRDLVSFIDKIHGR